MEPQLIKRKMEELIFLQICKNFTLAIKREQKRKINASGRISYFDSSEPRPYQKAIHLVRRRCEAEPKLGESYVP